MGVPGSTSSIIFDKLMLKSSDVRCKPAYVKITETTPGEYKGLSQSGCTTDDLSLECLTVYFPTDIARLNGKTPPEYTFKIESNVKGEGALLNLDATIQVLCSKAVKITIDQKYSLDFTFPLAESGS